MKNFIAVAALLSLGACAGAYVPTPYTPPIEPIKTIGIVDDPLPDEAIAYEVASTMSNFGLIGALIDAGVQSSRKNRVNEALQSVDYDAEANFETFLIDALAEREITAAVIEGADREDPKLLEDYQAAPDGTDVLLDFSVNAYGYANAGNQLWRPYVYADVRLVDPITGDTLLENRIVYNPIATQAGVITIAPDFEYVFQNRGDMIDQPEKLAVGIDAALKSVIDTAVKLMQ